MNYWFASSYLYCVARVHVGTDLAAADGCGCCVQFVSGLLARLEQAGWREAGRRETSLTTN